jgi:hypothetical protein
MYFPYKILHKYTHTHTQTQRYLKMTYCFEQSTPQQRLSSKKEVCLDKHEKKNCLVTGYLVFNLIHMDFVAMVLVVVLI